MYLRSSLPYPACTMQQRARRFVRRTVHVLVKTFNSMLTNKWDPKALQHAYTFIMLVPRRVNN